MTSESAKRYAGFLSKCFNGSDKPPKQKHIRFIILETYNDPTLTGLESALTDVSSLDTPIFYWKAYVTLHFVIREGFYQPQAIAKFQAYLNAPITLTITSGFYGYFIKHYNYYLRDKVAFHTKVYNLKGNFTPRTSHSITPYNNLPETMQYSMHIIKFFDLCVNILEKILSSLANELYLSMDEKGRNKLMAVYLILEDSIGLYSLIPEVIKYIIRLRPQTPDQLLKQVDDFHMIFSKYIFCIESVKKINFITNLVTLPDVSMSPIVLMIDRFIKSFQPEEPPPVNNETLVDTTVNINDQSQRTIEQLQMQLKNFQQQIFTLNRELEHVKTMSMKKYNTDMNYLKERLGLLSIENDLLKSEVEEKKMLDNKSSTEKMQKLEEMYMELRKAYKDTFQELSIVRNENKKHIEQNKEYEEKTSELKNKIECLNIDITRYESNVASLQAELDDTKLKKSQSSHELMNQYESVKTQLDMTQHKYQMQIATLTNEMTQFKSKLNTTSLYDLFISRITKRMEKIKSNLDDPPLFETHPSQLIHQLKQMNALFENVSNVNLTKYQDVLMFMVDAVEQLGKVSDASCGVANVSTNKELSESIMERVKSVFSDCNHIVCNIQDFEHNDRDADIRAKILQINSKLIDYIQFATRISDENISLKKEITPAEEIFVAQKSVKEAKAILAGILQQSKNVSTTHQLKVDPRIANSCTDLLNLVEELVQHASVLEQEISGNSSAHTDSSRDFYKKNHRWNEGLISAAKAIGIAANFLVQTADRTLSGNASFHEMVVAALDISASTAQLLTASRVQANPMSKNLENLVSCAHKVTSSSDALVSASSDQVKLSYDDNKIDITNLSVTQTKRLEMNTQIRCLELETSLERERSKLMSIRSQNYHAASNAVERRRK